MAENGNKETTGSGTPVIKMDKMLKGDNNNIPQNTKKRELPCS